MESQQALADMAILDTAERVGRAAHLWLGQNPVNSPSIFRTQCLAAGFIAKLCDSLDLSLRHGIFAAYTYALLQGEDTHALRIAEILLNTRSDRDVTAQFKQGRVMATTMLALIEAQGSEFIAQPVPAFGSRYTC